MGLSGREKRRLFEDEALPHLDALFSAAKYLTRNEQEANDLCQETMLRAYRFFDHFTAGTNCRAWLMTIMRNLARSRHSRKRPEQPATSIEDYERAIDLESIKLTDANNDPEAALIRGRAGQSVRQALHDLPDDFKAAVILVDMEDLTYEEAARALAVPVGTIRSRISRGRALIRKAIESMTGVQNLARPLKQRV